VELQGLRELRLLVEWFFQEFLVVFTVDDVEVAQGLYHKLFIGGAIVGDAGLDGLPELGDKVAKEGDLEGEIDDGLEIG
jgi:hypothetical protein